MGDRLEEIKSTVRIVNSVSSSTGWDALLLGDDYEWLIERAEQAELFQERRQYFCTQEVLDTKEQLKIAQERIKELEQDLIDFNNCSRQHCKKKVHLI